MGTSSSYATPGIISTRRCSLTTAQLTMIPEGFTATYAPLDFFELLLARHTS